MEGKLYKRFKCCLGNKYYTFTPPFVKSVFGSPVVSISPIGGWSIYKAFWSMLTIPTVHAEGPTATDKIVENMECQRKAGHAGVISEADIHQFLAQETGRDRLRMMYIKDAAGKYSNDLVLIYALCLQSTGVTFLLMSLFAGRHAKENFIDTNHATVFKTKFMANRQMTDSVFIQSVKGGARWGFQVGLFSFSFLLISQSMAAYRNKSSLWEYITAAMVTGGLFKMNLGLGGILAGSIFSGIGGVMAGLMIYGFMYLSNETQEQRHYWWLQNMLEQDRYLAGKTRSPEEIIRTYPLTKSENDFNAIPVEQQ